MVKVTKKDLLRWGLPSDLSESTWEYFDKLSLDRADEKRYAELVDIARKWRDAVLAGNKKYGLFMYGANGSGKSSMGVRLLLDFIEEGFKVQRVTMNRLQQEFYEHWRIPHIAMLPGILMIDELGKEYETKQSHIERAFEAIMKFRTERRLPTILVTNSTIEHIQQFYGETVHSVLRGRFIPMAFPEVDIRQMMADSEISEILSGNT